MWAAHNGHCDTCKLLLESGANIDFQDVVSAFLNLQTFTMCSEGDGGSGGAAQGGGGTGFFLSIPQGNVLHLSDNGMHQHWTHPLPRASNS